MNNYECYFLISVYYSQVDLVIDKYVLHSYLFFITLSLNYEHFPLNVTSLGS